MFKSYGLCGCDDSDFSIDMNALRAKAKASKMAKANCSQWQEMILKMINIRKLNNEIWNIFVLRAA